MEFSLNFYGKFKENVSITTAYMSNLFGLFCFLNFYE